MNLCRVCLWRRVYAKGLCVACYFYERRTGKERPDELILAHARREEERRATRGG